MSLIEGFNKAADFVSRGSILLGVLMKWTLMNRRKYLVTIGALGVSALAGCTEEIGSIGRPDEQQVKEEADSPSWDELYRNNSKWEGEPVHYSGVRISDVREDNGSFDFLIEHPDSSFTDSNFLYCNWDGDPFKESDRVDIWGVVTGTHTYSSLGGEQTVPEIDLVDVQLSDG